MSERGEAQFRSSVSGLWYDKPFAAGNIDALRVGDGILDILQAEQRAKLALWDEMVGALHGLIVEAEYSASSRLPFNAMSGHGEWTQLTNARAILAKARALEGDQL